MRQEAGDLSCWWAVFQDPVLDGLIAHAQFENLSLREAGYRVLQARAQLGIARGNLFPQSQYSSGGYRRVGTPVGPPSPITAESDWTTPYQRASMISYSGTETTSLTSGTMVLAWAGNSIFGAASAAPSWRQKTPWKPRLPATTRCW